MLVKHYPKISSLLILVCLISVKPADASIPSTQLLLLNGSCQGEESQFAKIAHTQDQSLLEKQKIRFLLDRIRESPYTFIRNGTEHTGKEAASHLRWKYGFVAGRIQTAEEFIDEIATRSHKTGENYYIVINGERYPAGEVFHHELDRLNAMIKAGNFQALS